MDETFEMLRGETRTFYCPNKLWNELRKQTNGCIPISAYIQQAIIEKMIKKEPKNKEYFLSLLVVNQ